MSFDAGLATFSSVAEAEPGNELVGSYDAGAATFEAIAESDTVPTDPTSPDSVPGDRIVIPISFISSTEVDGDDDLPAIPDRVRLLFSRGDTGLLTETIHAITEAADTLPDLPLDSWTLNLEDLVDGILVGSTTWQKDLQSVTEETPFAWRATSDYMLLNFLLEILSRTRGECR